MYLYGTSLLDPANTHSFKAHVGSKERPFASFPHSLNLQFLNKSVKRPSFYGIIIVTDEKTQVWSIRVRRDIKVGFSLINIGFGNMAAAARVMAIISPESAPVKRMIQDSRDKGDLIDATYGRKTRAVLIMDSGQIILSAVQPETISHRLMNKDVITSEGMDEN